MSLHHEIGVSALHDVTKTLFSKSGAGPRTMDFSYFFGKTRVLTDTLETHESRKILQNYAALKSIRRNLFTEAIRPQRDLEPFITPLMTSQCQHAQLTRRQGHLNLLVLSIIFQCVTCNLRDFAPFSPQGHFVSSCRRESLILKWSFAAVMSVFVFLTLQGRLLLRHL